MTSRVDANNRAAWTIFLGTPSVRRGRGSSNFDVVLLFNIPLRMKLVMLGRGHTDACNAAQRFPFRHRPDRTQPWMTCHFLNNVGRRKRVCLHVDEAEKKVAMRNFETPCEAINIVLVILNGRPPLHTDPTRLTRSSSHRLMSQLGTKSRLGLPVTHHGPCHLSLLTLAHLTKLPKLPTCRVVRSLHPAPRKTGTDTVA